jgi:hypothetical protein
MMIYVDERHEYCGRIKDLDPAVYIILTKNVAFELFTHSKMM